MTARLVDMARGVMASTLVKYDEFGEPVYCDDLRLGNRKARRQYLREQRRLMAAAGT